MMVTRTVPVTLLTAGLLAAGPTPATAQGNPVGGGGNHYFLAGAGNETGKAGLDFVYGNPDDNVYIGDFVDATGVFGGDAVDDVMVRRGNSFIIRGQGGRVFYYGDPGDTVLVGDWDGDGTDTLAVRRGNRYFVKNDVNTGKADYEFVYGDPGDTVFVGNWDGDTSEETSPNLELTDSLMVRRGNIFHVKNDTESGVADYRFEYGSPTDAVLVGDWATAPVYGDNPATPTKETGYVVTPGESGDYADQVATRRGFSYFLSREIDPAYQSVPTGYLVATRQIVGYGDATDTSFTAQLSFTYDLNGKPDTLLGDGLAIRR